MRRQKDVPKGSDKRRTILKGYAVKVGVTLFEWHVCLCRSVKGLNLWCYAALCKVLNGRAGAVEHRFSCQALGRS